MRRREFIKLIAGVTAAWPLAARAQQPEQIRRIGVLAPYGEGDPYAQVRNAAFLQGLQELGWRDGHNVRIDYRWGTGDADRNRKNAAELVTLAPDVFLAVGSPGLEAVQKATRKVPIVFVLAPDPVGAGYIDSLARPGGNTTGFMSWEYSVGAKWLELLKGIAPGVMRAAILRDTSTSGGVGQWGAIQTAAPSFGVEVIPVNLHDASEIDHAVAVFARTSNGGLIVPGSASAVIHSDLIIALAARYKLPAVFADRGFVAAGGLISYGPELVALFRRAAGYIDRILKGEKPGDLPVQAPTKYELVINLKTAKALGLDVPQSLLARADEIIE
jgi:putative tryptophan/tyrosine transport system substrate-binding protein